MISKDRHHTAKAFRDAVLTDSYVVRIFAYFNAGVSVETLAERFGVVSSTINRVLRGDIWTRNLKEIGLEPIKRGKGNYATNHHGNPGISNPRAKLTDAKVIQIRELHGKGVAQNAIAQQFSMSKMTVSNIVTGKSWKHLLSQNGGSQPCL
jgi:transposase